MTQTLQTDDLTYTITTTAFDEDYEPAASSRGTTNFANLARGADRRQNLHNALAMIDHRFNELAHWDNPTRDRYRLELEIVSADLHFTDDGDQVSFPLIEMLSTRVHDRATGAVHEGIVGNNLSSYVRDHDFSVVLPEHARRTGDRTGVPAGFGELHGRLFRHLLDSAAYRERFLQPPVICISVSTSRTYRRTENRHPVLGAEYRQDGDPSRTDAYFARMGLQVRFFLPPGSAAPLAFYHRGDLLNDHAPLALIALVATMESFQRIYRPEVYNANTAAGPVYRASLENPDHSVTRIGYDRVERAELALTQGRFTQERLIAPHGALLERWAAAHAAAHAAHDDAAPTARDTAALDA